MKQKKKYMVAIFIIILTVSTNIYAMDEVMNSQMDTLNISKFIKEANNYTKETFPDMDIGTLLNSAIKGNVDTSAVYKAVGLILGKEVIEMLKVLR